MSSNNLLPRGKTWIALGMALAVVLALTLTARARISAAPSVDLARRIFDRLSLLYFLDGEMEKSIALQKEVMDRSETARKGMVAKRGAELVGMLDRKGEAAEAKRWRDEIKGLPVPVKAVRPGASSTSKMPKSSSNKGTVGKSGSETERPPVPAYVKGQSGASSGKVVGATSVPSTVTPSSSRAGTARPVPIQPAKPAVRVYSLDAKPLLPSDLPRGPSVQPGDEAKKAVVLTKSQSNQLQALSQVRVSLNFRDVEIADIVRLLATKANLNIVSRNQITGRTTINFENIAVGTALDTILKTNDYSYEQREGIIWIFKKGQEPPETRVFFVRNAFAADLYPMIEQNLKQLDNTGNVAAVGESGAKSGEPTIVSEPAAAGAGGSSQPASGGAGPGASSQPTSGGAGPGASSQPTSGGAGPGASSQPTSGGAGPGASSQSTSGGAGSGASSQPASGGSGSGSGASSQSTGGSRWNLQLDERSNSIIVTAPRFKLEEIARLIEVFDVQMENRRMDEHIFKVKYIDQATLEKAIKMVLPRFSPEKQMFNIKRVDSGSSGSSGGSSGSGGGSTGGMGGGSTAAGS